jgi:hypothetical protein
MGDWQDIGSNIIKLEGYGLYVTYINSNVYVCNIIPRSGLPELDPDGCISWEKLTDPPNQKFLNLVNARYGLSLIMTNYDKSMSIRDIRDHITTQKRIKDGKDC